MQRAGSPQKMSDQDKRIWTLIYGSHDLEQMLWYLPEIGTKLRARDRRESSQWWASLEAICARWTIFARYSPHSETMREAAMFLNAIRTLKEWLK